MLPHQAYEFNIREVERMTEREEKRLNELLAKKETEEKADKEFFKNVKKRRAEVLKVLGIKEQEEPQTNYYEQELRRMADMYGIDIWDLMEYIKSEQQINFYKRTHQNKGV